MKVGKTTDHFWHTDAEWAPKGIKKANILESPLFFSPTPFLYKKSSARFHVEWSTVLARTVRAPVRLQPSSAATSAERLQTSFIWGTDTARELQSSTSASTSCWEELRSHGSRVKQGPPEATERAPDLAQGRVKRLTPGMKP